MKPQTDEQDAHAISLAAIDAMDQPANDRDALKAVLKEGIKIAKRTLWLPMANADEVYIKGWIKEAEKLL